MNFKGEFGIYEKPDVQKVYTVFEVAELLDTSVENIRNIANYYHIDYRVIMHKMIFDYDSVRLVKERYEARLNKKKQQSITKRLEKTPEKAEVPEDHSLVTDKRCLDLNFWPDVVPKCFEELDA